MIALSIECDDKGHKTITMIESIGIKNYKSIVDLKFDVGRVNVFIGENGSGKSNILEAIALASAAEADKLDNEFLTSRGIRVTDPLSMRSKFNPAPEQPIEINIKSDLKEKNYRLENDNQPYPKWHYDRGEGLPEFVQQGNRITFKVDILKWMQGKRKDIKDKEKDSLELDFLRALLDESITYEALEEKRAKLIDRLSLSIEDIIIYSPEETALRNLYQEGQIEPLGIHGEGLLKLIQVLDKNGSDNYELDKGDSCSPMATPIETVKESLVSLGWFEDIDVSNSNTNPAEEERIRVRDRFTQSWFDQRSANEGFLFVLLYAALMVSKDTPSIFAIDNVDASLNPKLCTKIVSDIARLAKQFNKQCFLTAHNPAILDGIDLGDDEQRLFVVSRNRKGHTRVKRIGIESKPVSSTGEELKLSEAFLRGYLGGLPKNF